MVASTRSCRALLAARGAPTKTRAGHRGRRTSQKLQNLSSFSKYSQLPPEIQHNILKLVLGAGRRRVVDEDPRRDCPPILLACKDFYNALKPILDQRLMCYHPYLLLHESINLQLVRELELWIHSGDSLALLANLRTFSPQIESIVLVFPSLPGIFRDQDLETIVQEIALDVFAGFFAVPKLSLLTFHNGKNGEHPRAVRNKYWGKGRTLLQRKNHILWCAFNHALRCYRREMKETQTPDSTRLAGCFQDALRKVRKRDFRRSRQAVFHCDRCLGDHEPRKITNREGVTSDTDPDPLYDESSDDAEDW